MRFALPEWWPDMPRPDLKPGDLCVVETANNPLNNGKIVQLIRFVGYVPGWLGSDRWETDTEVASATTSKTTNCIRETRLRLVPKENP